MQALADATGTPIVALTDVIAFEAEWNSRMGGDATQDLRTLIGFTMYQLIHRHNVHPRTLADYLRGCLRCVESDKFDAPMP